MNAAVVSREYTRLASFKERGFSIANHPIQDLETVFRPIPEEQSGNPPSHYLTGDGLAKNQIRMASSIGTLLRI
jgi:hypothetical protein